MVCWHMSASTLRRYSFGLRVLTSPRLTPGPSRPIHHPGSDFTTKHAGGPLVCSSPADPDKAESDGGILCSVPRLMPVEA